MYEKLTWNSYCLYHRAAFFALYRLSSACGQVKTYSFLVSRHLRLIPAELARCGATPKLLQRSRAPAIRERKSQMAALVAALVAAAALVPTPAPRTPAA